MAETARYPNMRRIFPLLLLPLLAACASTSEPPPARTAAVTRSAAGPFGERLAATAEREWRDWGRITVDGWPVALDRTPDATPELFERLMTYWSATRDGPGIVAAHRHFRDTITVPSATTASLDPAVGLGFNVIPSNVSISSYNNPAWSAAFVSYAMQEAGAVGFRPASAHALYLDGLFAQAAANPADAPYIPRTPTEYAPRPGDLVCWDRSASPLPNWQSRMLETGRSRPMHCDIVVSATTGRVDLIGGNALDVVLRRRVETDAQGLLVPPPLDRPPYLVVMENRR
ncbi:DUF2272 domain-containing protein [Muricoccus radiodurans]|uniref:DUF2272 domain-containing protein n=1 Tax=Muricoccus radiodurans TaxID=2231721 RepID=UPI003CE72FFC